MNGWLTEQWEQIRGNAKWDAIKYTGAFALAAAYFVLQRVRHLAPDWWVAAGMFVAYFVVVLLERNKKQVAQTGAQTAALIPGTPTFKLDAKEIFRTAYYSSLTEEVEKNIRIAASENQPNDREGFMAKLIGLGLVASLYDLIWAYIFRSQILMLTELNRKGGLMPLSEAKPFYDTAANENPTAYNAYSFQQWVDFLKSQILIIVHPSQMIEITVRGKDFLKYLLHWARTPDMRKF